jgi:hypothetical protein
MSKVKWRSLSWVVSWIAVVFVISLSSGCDKSGQIRSELQSHQAEWSSRLAAMRGREVTLEGRFAALPAPSGGKDADVQQAQRRRLEASIAGSRQTLADIQLHVEESAREVEAAIGHGETEGQEALEAVSARMGEYLHRQEEELASGEAAVIRVAEVH